MASSFKDLKVWQKARVLVAEIYRNTYKFPAEELYGLRNQVRRAAVSVPSNIAEGHRRGSDKEFKQFLNIARGSLAEVETQVILSNDLKYINDAATQKLLEQVEEIGKMLNGLMNSLS